MSIDQHLAVRPDLADDVNLGLDLVLSALHPALCTMARSARERWAAQPRPLTSRRRATLTTGVVTRVVDAIRNYSTGMAVQVVDGPSIGTPGSGPDVRGPPSHHGALGAGDPGTRWRGAWR